MSGPQDIGLASGTSPNQESVLPSLTPGQVAPLVLLLAGLLWMLLRGARRFMAWTVDTQNQGQHKRVVDAERLLRSTLNALRCHIAILDENGRVLTVNQSWETWVRATACRRTPAVCGSGQAPSKNKAPAHCGSVEAVAVGIRKVLRREQADFCLEYACHSCAGRRWFAVNVRPFGDDGPLRVVVTHEDITARKLAEERVLYQALHDGLTGLPNRPLFRQRVEECVRRAREDADFRFAVMFIDLDRFKLINDSLGHSIGDQVLVVVAGKLEQCILSAVAAGRRIGRHIVARMGGDEFTVLLEGIGGLEDATEVAQGMISALDRPFVVEKHEVFTAASIGIAGGEVRYQEAEDVVRDADAAMYRAKSAGKGRFVVFDRSMHAEAARRLQLEGELRRAVEYEELELHYQPIVAPRDGQIKGFEALVRWRHPTRGLLPPDDFISLAEEMGMIGVIGDWVLRTACRQLRQWQDRYPAAAPLTMSVNLSGRQLTMAGLTARIEAAIREARIAPNALKLEITESTMINNDQAEEVLRQIQGLGVGLQMDDFGTGYSALSCLHRFPLGGLKVDRSFILNADRQPTHLAVLKAVGALTRSLGIELIVEGVETQAQADLVRRLSCGLWQGYLFAAPLAPAEAGELLALQTRALDKSTSEKASPVTDLEALAC